VETAVDCLDEIDPAALDGLTAELLPRGISRVSTDSL